ncbi:NAD(P)-dependent oxidoreductase [Sphingomonas sp. So64.6b]|uniref:NAD(P)-dependent oxidoreductase n=1 Tax=Sphingomonas sp. So64.6b TaxID=2997354 RepID=UPI0016015C77|nr:NAD(P)-dependent oxidoreductase [Sphingomonas sp. So64.6b]QNA84224.1 NAD(P)-dependent oxidoreductase [Sphingomonas sp. So64.6b]
MKIAIIGASGNAGTRILTEARRRGHEVTAIARHSGPNNGDTGVNWKTADLADPDAITAALAGHEVTILSVPFRTTDFDRALDGIRRSGVGRLLVVGGAASLEVAPGQVLLDTPDFPDFIKPEAEPARQALNRLREEGALDWTFLSPSMMFGPGERTGKFRLGTDTLLTAEDGQSHISYEDYAIALLDEVETPRHSRARFTVGY